MSQPWQLGCRCLCPQSDFNSLSLSCLNSVQFSINTLNGFGIQNIFWYGILIETSELHICGCLFVYFCFGVFSWFLGTLVQMKRLGSYCYSTHTHKLHTKSLQMCASFKILNFQWGFSVCLGLCGGFLTGFCSDQGPIPTGGELGDYFCGFYLHACLSTWLQLRSVDANPLSGVYVQCWLQLTGAGEEMYLISWT